MKLVNDIDEDTNPGTPKAKRSLTELNDCVGNLGRDVASLQRHITIFQEKLCETLSQKVAEAVSSEMGELTSQVTKLVNITMELQIVTESLIGRCQNLEDRVSTLERESSSRISLPPPR